MPRFTGVLLARCRQLGKNPNFRGPCDRLSHRAKNRDFFPMAEERHSSPREKGEYLLLHLSQQTSRDRCRRRYSRTLTLGTNRTIVSDGNLCGPENREGPQPRDPPEAPPGPPGIISTTLTLFGPPKNRISSRFSRGKSGGRKKGGFFRH